MDDLKDENAPRVLTNEEENAAVMPGIESKMFEELWHRARLIARDNMEAALNGARMAGLDNLPRRPSTEQVDYAARKLLRQWGDKRIRDAVMDFANMFE